MGRKNVLSIKGLIIKALSLTSLLLVKGGRNKCTKETVNVIGASSNMLTERTLVGIQNQAGLGGVLNYLSYARHV